MRFGKWRGAAVAVALAFGIVMGQTGPAWALGIVHTIPREVDAVDVNTGGPYFAPPVPYGHYAKGCPLEGLHSVFGRLCCLLHGGCGACGGAGCGACGGHGCGGAGDPGCGGLGGCGHGGGGLFHRDGCVACGGSGCGFCAGRGLLHGGKGGGGCAGKASTIVASAQASPAPTPQVVTPSPQFECSQKGCHLGKKHFHRLGRGCNACGGIGDGCGICGGGNGLLGHGGLGDPCHACGGRGCGLCGGGSGGLCGACGGRGCGFCGGAKSLLGLPRSLIAKVFHVGEIKYFVGPGGPVPLTPGYVPYVVTTRSPRDFLSFPPYSNLDP